MSNSDPTSSETIEKGSSLWNDAFIRLRKNKLATIGLLIVITILILCFIVTPILKMSGMDPNAQDLANKLQGPSAEHWLGTDELGRDLFIRILDGGQISLLVAITATLLTITIGVIYGSISGYIGGRLDGLMMRIVDGLLAMPFLIIVILFREFISAKLENFGQWLTNDMEMNADLVLRFMNIAPLILAIAAFGWLTMSRIVRTSSASLAQQEFVEAARSLGLAHRSSPTCSPPLSSTPLSPFPPSSSTRPPSLSSALA